VLNLKSTHAVVSWLNKIVWELSPNDNDDFSFTYKAFNFLHRSTLCHILLTSSNLLYYSHLFSIMIPSTQQVTLFHPKRSTTSKNPCFKPSGNAIHKIPTSISSRHVQKVALEHNSLFLWSERACWQFNWIESNCLFVISNSFLLTFSLCIHTQREGKKRKLVFTSRLQTREQSVCPKSQRISNTNTNTFCPHVKGNWCRYCRLVGTDKLTFRPIDPYNHSKTALIH